MSRPPSLLPGDGRRSVVTDDPRAGAQRPLLIEARDVFQEAVAYGWIHSNPAAAVRHQLLAQARLRAVKIE